MSMTNEELLALIKAQISSTPSEGIASAQDAAEFIDLAVDQTGILQEIRVETDIRTSFHLDTLALGEPVIIEATEGEEPASGDVVAPSRSRKTLTPTEVIAAFDVTFSFLRKNIERERINETLNQVFAKRFGKDIVRLAFAGDTSVVGTTRADKAIKILDGYVVQAQADGDVHDYTIPASPNYASTVFPAMVESMPKDYRDNREELGFFLTADVYDAYAAEIGSRATALGDMLLAGPWKRNLSYMGITLYPVFGMPDGKMILTLKENLAVGFGQSLTVGRDVNNRARLLKVTMTADVDCKYAVGDAVVLGATA